MLLFRWVFCLATGAAANAVAFKLNPYKPNLLSTRVDRIFSLAESSLLTVNEDNVEKVLDLVRPQLESDGGGVTLLGIEDHNVTVKFEGACRSCPHRISTVKGVIEATLARFLKAHPGKKITVILSNDK